MIATVAAVALDPSTVVVRSPAIMASEIDGEAVMLSVDTGTYYGLDPVGTDIWNLVAEPRSIADVCADLVERYEVEAETCHADVVEFLEVLIADGSVHVVA